MRISARAWPVPLMLAVAILAQKLFLESRYDVAGHAAEHLGSASAPFFAGALLGILLWATPAARRQPDVLAGAAAALALTAAIRRRRHVSNRVAAVAAVLNVLFPPWIIPGAGIVVLVGAPSFVRIRQPEGL